MIDRRLFTHFEWRILGLVLLLSSIGLLNLYSFTSNGEGTLSALFLKQILWLGIGLVVMWAVAFIEYRYYADFAYPIFFILLLLLILVFGFGVITSGARRWIRMGSFSFQPSELMKIALIIALAKFYQKPPDRKGYSLKELSLPFLFLLMPVILILKQPDLGTAIILILIFFSILLFVKIRFSSLLLLMGIGAALIPMGWSLLKEYQKRRILTFLNPELDPLGVGYHLIQSKIAIGSGGVLGKGFMKGTQCKLGFLPEPHTDFIFSALAEEWGLVGCFVVMGLYLILILWGLRVVVQSKDRFSAILSFGAVSMLFWHTFINMGMAMGMMPVVGIPLPLLSYGGSFLLSTMMGIGLLFNVSMRRFLF